MDSIALLWAQYGPYHQARATKLAEMADPIQVHAIEIANSTDEYQWQRPKEGLPVNCLCPGVAFEHTRFMQVFCRARRTLHKLNIGVCLLPSYSPKQSLACFLAAKSLNLPTVMMNDSHRGTARARGVAAFFKRHLVRSFDAAFVAGRPQRSYFSSLGFPANKIFTGYDAVDNDYFSQQANEVRARATDFRSRYRLPEHYFLNLGRFVAKKNLSTLIRAYRLFLDETPDSRTHLVMVGSGEQERELLGRCHEYKLPVYDKRSAGKIPTELRESVPGVHFYGFRQIAENPIFYALAEAFVLPSLHEEWGLVVNEAMASGLPVVVSETAGCAEDLLEMGDPWNKIPGRELAWLAELKLIPRIRDNGFAFDAKSSEELSRILRWLHISPVSRSIMGSASRRIIDKFSCENFARNALLAVNAALGEWPSPAAPSPDSSKTVWSPPASQVPVHLAIRGPKGL